MDQKRVIQLAMGYWPVEGQKCRNTLRGDKRPNCIFKWQSGYLRLFDYGRDLYHKKNCFDLVALKYLGRLISSKEDLSKVLRIIHDNVGEIGKLEQKFPDKFRASLEVEMRAVPEAGLYYWGEYGITMSQLIDDKVTGVEKFSFNTEAEPRVNKIVYPEDVAFCYWYKSGRKKVYRPRQTEPWKKWRTDAIETDVHFDDGQRCEECFIFGSYKDARVAKNAGVTAKGLQSESAWPGEDIIKRWSAECKMLYFLFDLDRGGYDNSKYMVEKCKKINVPAAAIYLPPRIKTEHGKKDIAEARLKFNSTLIHQAVMIAKNNVILRSL